MSRLRSLFSHKCFERRILLYLAALRAGLTALLSLAFIDVGVGSMPPAVVLVLVPFVASAVAIVSADVLERALRLLAFGYVDNPHVSPRGEWEGWNGPTRREHEAEWRRRMFTPVWPDDPNPPRPPGVPPHYPFPIPTLCGRLVALVRLQWL